jgi:hypothetical protein
MIANNPGPAETQRRVVRVTAEVRGQQPEEQDVGELVEIRDVPDACDLAPEARTMVPSRAAGQTRRSRAERLRSTVQPRAIPLMAKPSGPSAQFWSEWVMCLARLSIRN